MAYDEGLAERIRELTDARAGFFEKKMFGGLGFLLNGNMCCGVHGSDLIVRLDPHKAEEALKDPNVRVFDMTGRPMKGWVVVGSEGLHSAESLSKWFLRGLEFAESLPPK